MTKIKNLVAVIGRVSLRPTFLQAVDSCDAATNPPGQYIDLIKAHFRTAMPPDSSVMGPVRNIVVLVFLLVLGPSAAAEPCQERQILGAWESSEGGGFFEQFELSRSATAHTFNSWLHERPDLVDASWELRGCVLTITPKLNDLPPFTYVISVRQGKLLLREADERIPASYSRIKREPRQSNP